MRALVLLICLALVAEVMAQTTVYKRVRPDGSAEFADEPFPGSEAVQLPELPPARPRPTPDANATSVPTPAPASPPAAPVTKEPEQAYQQIRIQNPGAGETVFHESSGLRVEVAIQPALKEGHKVAVRVDGKQVATGAQTSFLVPGLGRGTHTVAATIIDAQGRALLQSSPVTFQLRQHSTLTR